MAAAIVAFAFVTGQSSGPPNGTAAAVITGNIAHLVYWRSASIITADVNMRMVPAMIGFRLLTKAGQKTHGKNGNEKGEFHRHAIWFTHAWTTLTVLYSP